MHWRVVGLDHRSGGDLRTLKQTSFEVAHLQVPLRPAAPVRAVVVKATFALVERGVCTLASEQRLPTGELYHDDDVERSLRYPDDFVPFKPVGECFVLGSFRSPGGRPVPMGKVAFRVGPVHKELAVFGERSWGILGPSEPAPTARVPLQWEYAAGGSGVRENPVGRLREAVPQIENPQALVLSRSDRARPTGTGPISRTWAPRASRAGTYDETWLAHLYPHLAADVDWSFFCSAPADQRIEGYWRGDEELVLIGLDPEWTRIECRLPGVRPRVGWVFTEGSEVREVREVPLLLDTLVIDADAREVLAIWRGSTDEPEGATHVVAIDQALDERTSLTRATHELLAEERKARLLPDDDAPRERATAPRLAAPALRDAAARQAARVEPGGASSPPPLGAPIASAVASELVRGLSERASPAAPSMSPDRAAELERQADAERGRRIRSRGARFKLDAASRAGGSCANIDLAGLNLEGIRIQDIDLSGADLSGAQLAGAYFSGVRLDEARLDGADLSGARFVKCSMIETSLTRATGEGLLIQDANMRGAYLDGVELPRASFVHARGAGVDFHGARLIEANFDACDFERARAGAAILSGASFSGCRLKDAHLAEGSVLRQVRFHKCDLRGLRAFEAEADRIFISESSADRARFGQSSLLEAAFDRVSLVRADFCGARLDGARFARTILRRARFDGASLVGAALPGVDLFQARLPGADLSDTDLRGANLFQAELLDARLDGARLDLANLAGTRRAKP